MRRKEDERNEKVRIAEIGKVQDFKVDESTEK